MDSCIDENINIYFCLLFLLLIDWRLGNQIEKIDNILLEFFRNSDPLNCLNLAFIQVQSLENRAFLATGPLLKESIFSYLRKKNSSYDHDQLIKSGKIEGKKFYVKQDLP